MRRLRTTIRMRNSKRRAIPTTRAPRSITCSRSRSRLRGVLVAELSNARQFRLTDAPAPADPGPNQIQVAVKAVGICGSDLHYFGEGGIGTARCVYPLVLGHEPAGVWVKTCAGVSGCS